MVRVIKLLWSPESVECDWNHGRIEFAGVRLFGDHALKANTHKHNIVARNNAEAEQHLAANEELCWGSWKSCSISDGLRTAIEASFAQ